ncbi:MAG: ATP-binding protein [Cyanobacteria bacterium P01_F01_bin.53]
MVSDFIVKTKAAIAQLTDAQISYATVDLTNCDREPIHTPSAIQPHGVLVVVSAEDWTITHISQNTQQFLGQSPESLLGESLQTLIDDAQIQKIKTCLDEAFEAVNPLRLDIEGVLQPFMGILHRSGQSLILELEPTEQPANMDFFDFYGRVKRPVGRLHKTQTLKELFETTVEEIQQLSGFDRVMVYQLDEDGSGHVIAEAKQPDMTAYLGLHYPPSDIPKQAKYLYMLNCLRLIPDVAYRPVSIASVHTTNASTTDGPPTLDMSLATLRSVSPLHIEYLQNMGVRATLTISLMRDQQLWGMIVCHHNSARKLSYECRSICEFLGQTVAMELAAKETHQDSDDKLKLKAIQASFIETLAQSQTLKEGLTTHTQQLLALTNSSGVAFCDKGNITLLGDTPTHSEVDQLAGWIGNQFAQKSVYTTAALSEVYPPAAEFEGRTGGLLALAISKRQQLYVLWFRPEVLQTVNWAGDPSQPLDVDENGMPKMSPRRSFALWQEHIQHHSLRWKACEVEAALELRSAIIGLVLRRADDLAQLNAELERSNVELDAFAYIASHDLKEPLRGIHNYSSFLIEDYGTTLDQDGVDKLNTLMRLTQRMEKLINSLLHYSRLGRAELQLETVDLNELIDGVIEMVKISKPEAVDFDVPRALPATECDRTQTAELFTNLVTNAIKYNNKAKKQIEIGYRSAQQAIETGIIPPGNEGLITTPVYYVRDNGIGIREKHLTSVFRIFKRLHAPNRFGGGTGAGLTIARKIAERHGGILWLSSVYGEGSTFYFTLQGEKRDG